MEAAGRGSMMPGRRQVKNMSTVGSPAECPVCMTGYDGTVQRPRTLPCGHTVCTLCIDQLKVRGRVACPECRVSHAVPEGGQFPVCYAVEALIRMVKDAEVASAAAAAVASPPPSAGEREGAAVVAAAGKKEAAGLSQKMRSSLQEQEATVVAAITACRNAQSQLDQYQTTLAGWGKRQQQLEDRLLGLVDQSRSARELLQQEVSRAAAKEKELKKGEQGLQAMLEKLRTLTIEQEVGAAVSEVLSCTGEAEQAVEECRESFPDAITVTTARKVNVASSAALEAAQAALENLATEEPRPQADPDSTVMDRLYLIWTGSLTAEDLRSLTQPARRLLEAGRVFAVHQVEGQRQHARISLEAGQLCLHALKDLPPPRGATTLQVSEVVPPSPCCTVFLDLSWPGSAPRRVQIRLSPDTPRGRQFLLLCTGQRGPSYVNTRLHEVWGKGKVGEYVKGGDYECNDGRGSSILLPGLGEGEYRKSGRAGDVFGLRWADPTRGECGQFGIFTKDSQDGVRSPRVFGEVVDGLDVVAKVAQRRDIKDVTVAECGVML